MTQIRNVKAVALTKVAKLNPRSFSEAVCDDDLVSFVPMKYVEEESGRLNSEEVKQWQDVKKGYTPFENGDVIFAKITPCMENGKYALATNLHNGRAAGSTEFHVFRPTVYLDSKYLLFFLFSPEVRREAKRNMRGAAGQLRVPPIFFEELQIPVPPLDEQQCIVAEIEKQFTRLDAGVASLKRVRTALKRYRASVLKAACEGQFPHEPISVAIDSLDQGWSPKCEPIASPSNDVWAVMKTSAIQHGRFVEQENKQLPTALPPRPHLELQPGDLLITRAGPRARAGVACLIKSTRPRLMLCDKAYRVRAKQEVADPAFLEIVLNAPHIVDAIDELKTGISDSGVNLTQKGFQELVVPLPPIAEQRRIVAEVERRLSVIEELDATISTELQRAKRLRQSVLQSAFCS